MTSYSAYICSNVEKKKVSDKFALCELNNWFFVIFLFQLNTLLVALIAVRDEEEKCPEMN